MNNIVIIRALLWQLEHAAAVITQLRRENAALRTAAAAPWLPQNSPTGQARLEQGQYVKERGGRG